ncbi:hypothetical protein PRK78_001063 [Emydomyces testavorans]|uniref:Uncharacterized protein n=1 Tax=Emydomyces testavorans TaxID=2070801 RepID=A0AAF0IGB0_9EURO|nr:hypothetical protein PRK78_001063 [Emydomyces testavorans]
MSEMEENVVWTCSALEAAKRRVLSGLSRPLTLLGASQGRLKPVVDVGEDGSDSESLPVTNNAEIERPIGGHGCESSERLDLTERSQQGAGALLKYGVPTGVREKATQPPMRRAER